MNTARQGIAQEVATARQGLADTSAAMADQITNSILSRRSS
jgi:hypothetical protein